MSGGAHALAGTPGSQQAMALVLNLAKRGHYNKWFDRQAVRRTNSLYQAGFGQPVDRKTVRALDISHVLWIETNDSQSSAAMMLSRTSTDEPPIYRVQGLAVSPDMRRQGYGTALLRSLDVVLPKGTTVWLCVDKDKDSTEWLVLWYRRMGFELAYRDPRLNHGGSEIPMKKIVPDCARNE